MVMTTVAVCVVVAVVVAAVRLAERAAVLEFALLTLRAVVIGLAVHHAPVTVISSATATSSATGATSISGATATSTATGASPRAVAAVGLAKRFAVLEFALLTLRTIDVRCAGVPRHVSALPLACGELGGSYS